MCIAVKWSCTNKIKAKKIIFEYMKINMNWYEELLKLMFGFPWNMVKTKKKKQKILIKWYQWKYGVSY